jgi:hypothetical protein
MATHQEDTTNSRSYAAALGCSSSKYEPSGPESFTRNAHSVEGSRDTGFSPEIDPQALEFAQKFYEQFSYALTKMGHRGDMFKLWNDAFVPTTEGAKSVDFNKVLYAMAFGLKVCRVKQNTHVLWKVNRPRDDQRQDQHRYRDDRGHRDEAPRYRGHRDEAPRHRDDRGRHEEQPRYRDDRGHRDEAPRYRDDRGHRDEAPRYRGRHEEQPRYRDDRDRSHHVSEHSRWDRN